MFVRGNGTSEENSFTFDIREFHSHPCFSAVGNEQEYCLELFGIDTDFEEMIRTNSLNSLLIDYMLVRRCEGLFNDALSACLKENITLLPQLRAQLNAQPRTMTGSVLSAGDTDDDADEEESTADAPRSRYLRSQRVWALCKDHENSQAGCYQDYLRFVTDDTLAISELEKMLGRSSGTSDDDTDAGSGLDVNTSTRSNSQVGSEEAEDPATPAERANWLWDLCADNGNDQTICYRQHFRTAQNMNTNLNELEATIRGM